MKRLTVSPCVRKVRRRLRTLCIPTPHLVPSWRRLPILAKAIIASFAFVSLLVFSQPTYFLLPLQSNMNHARHTLKGPHRRNSIDGEMILSYPFASNIIVSEQNRFIFCPVPKAANSNWKYLIRKFEGLRDYTDLTKAHDHNLSGLRYLSNYSPLELESILSDDSFFKFVFVRNPFRRLASCYMDKFLNNNQTYVHTEYRSFLAQLFTWHYARTVDIQHEPRPSFRSFVNELTKQNPAAMNAHWMPQTIHCGLGVMPYDFIGRMEDLDRHARHVLKVLGKTEDHFPTQGEIGFLPSGTTRSAMASLYSADIVAKVRAIYDMDFTFLGYNKCESKTDGLACMQ